MVTDFKAFCTMMGSEPRGLSRRLYKDTACGAALTLHLANGAALYEDQHAALTPESPVVAVSVSSIVEGSDVEVSPRRLDFPFTVDAWNGAVGAVEEEADFYWRRDNHDHFFVERPGVLRPAVVVGVDKGWGPTVLFDGNDGTGLTTAERLAVTQTLMAWDDPQPGTSRKVGDLTVQCYSQADLTF